MKRKTLTISLLVLFLYVPLFRQESTDESWLRGTWEISYKVDGMKYVDMITIIEINEQNRIKGVDERSNPIYGLIYRGNVSISNSGEIMKYGSSIACLCASWNFSNHKKSGTKTVTVIYTHPTYDEIYYEFFKIKVKKVKQ